MTVKEKLAKFRAERGQEYHESLVAQGYSPEQIAANEQFTDAVAEIIDQKVITGAQGGEIFINYAMFKLINQVIFGEGREELGEGVRELPHQPASRMVN